MTGPQRASPTRRRRPRRIPIVLATWAALGAGTLGGAAADPCEPAARAELGRLGVPPDTVAGISFVDVTDGGRSGQRVVGYEAWTSLTSCRGSVVTKFNLACRVRETYARGDCRLSGVRTYR